MKKVPRQNESNQEASKAPKLALFSSLASKQVRHHASLMKLLGAYDELRWSLKRPLRPPAKTVQNRDSVHQATKPLRKKKHRLQALKATEAVTLLSWQSCIKTQSQLSLLNPTVCNQGTCQDSFLHTLSTPSLLEGPHGSSANARQRTPAPARTLNQSTSTDHTCQGALTSRAFLMARLRKCWADSVEVGALLPRIASIPLQPHTCDNTGD